MKFHIKIVYLEHIHLIGYNMIFFNCNWVPSRWLWSVNVYKNRKEKAIYKRTNKHTKHTKAQNKQTRKKYTKQTKLLTTGIINTFQYSVFRFTAQFNLLLVYKFVTIYNYLLKINFEFHFPPPLSLFLFSLA